MLIFRKVCYFNLFKRKFTYFPPIMYLPGNFMKQLSAKFLLKKWSEIAKFENSHNRFDNFFFYSFFSIRVFFQGHWRLTGHSRGRERTIFYSTLPIPPAYEHPEIYLQLCMWHDYHIFLIASLVFTRLLLDEIYHLIELPFDWLMMWH